MTIEKRGVSFKLSNYALPTPKNLEFLFELLEDVVKLLTGFSILMEANDWVPICILVIGLVCAKLKKFFANIAVEGDKEMVSVNFPASVADVVEVKHETLNKDEIVKP